jgi:hypothetical protein
MSSGERGQEGLGGGDDSAGHLVAILLLYTTAIPLATYVYVSLVYPASAALEQQPLRFAQSLGCSYILSSVVQAVWTTLPVIACLAAVRGCRAVPALLAAVGVQQVIAPVMTAADHVHYMFQSVAAGVNFPQGFWVCLVWGVQRCLAPAVLAAVLVMCFFTMGSAVLRVSKVRRNSCGDTRLTGVTLLALAAGWVLHFGLINRPDALIDRFASGWAAYNSTLPRAMLALRALAEVTWPCLLGWMGLRMVSRRRITSLALIKAMVLSWLCLVLWMSLDAVGSGRFAGGGWRDVGRIFLARAFTWVPMGVLAWYWLPVASGGRPLGMSDPPLCMKCGYNLRGNVSGRCPECGTPVTAALEKKRE